MKLIDLYYKLVPYKSLRFLLVGGLNTAFGMGLYCLLIFIGLSYTWATGIAQVLGVLFNFFTTGKLVFNDTDFKHIFRFVITYIATYFINIGINKAAQDYLAMNTYWSGITATIITAACSFVILNGFVYKKKFSLK